MKTWILGTRGSKLALRQTEIVRGALEKCHPGSRFDTRIIRTTGDSDWERPLYLIGEKGLFVKEIEEALVKGDIDMAVHSMKDLPTLLQGGLTVGAILEREDPRDVFISVKHHRLSSVPGGGRIGTSSMRRRAQLLAVNSSWEIVPLRGNVDTRIRKLTEQELDGVILACAGVKRMGYEERIREVLPIEMMVPSGGQGAIGVEVRKDDEALALAAPLNHERSFLEVTLERRLQEAVGGGCSVPLGINADISGDRITLRMVFGQEDGTILFRGVVSQDREKADLAVTTLLQQFRSALAAR